MEYTRECMWDKEQLKVGICDDSLRRKTRNSTLSIARNAYEVTSNKVKTKERFFWKQKPKKKETTKIGLCDDNKKKKWYDCSITQILTISRSNIFPNIYIYFLYGEVKRERKSIFFLFKIELARWIGVLVCISLCFALHSQTQTKAKKISFPIEIFSSIFNHNTILFIADCFEVYFIK